MRTDDILLLVKMNALELSQHSAISTMSILSLWKRPTGQKDAMQEIFEYIKYFDGRTKIRDGQNIKLAG
mgnify:CR=1 FL=1